MYKIKEDKKKKIKTRMRENYKKGRRESKEEENPLRRR